MLSLIVALEPATPLGALWRFALSRDAAPGVHTGSDANADGMLVDQGNAPMALLPRSDELVAVVPAARLSWHRMTLPKISAARLRSALDGVLEERMLDDPAALHFALSPGASAGEPAWVAACNKAWLQDLLGAFEGAGRPVSRVVPEYAPQPDGQPPVWHATGAVENACLVRCADDGVQQLPLIPASCEVLGLHPGTAEHRARIEVVGATEGGNGDGRGEVGEPVRLTCFADPAVAGLAEQLLGVHTSAHSSAHTNTYTGAPVSLHIEVLHPAQRLVLASRSGWDLAQFDLASTGRTRLVRRAGLAWTQWLGSPAWKPARWALVTLLLAHVVGLNVAAWRERAALQAKQGEVRQVLTQTFPKIQLVVDAPVQMERELASMRLATGAVSSRDLESMLGLVAANTRAAPAPTALDFVTGDLTLKGFQVPEIESKALAGALPAAGYSYQVEGTTWRITPRLLSVPVKTGPGAAP